MPTSSPRIGFPRLSGTAKHLLVLGLCVGCEADLGKTGRLTTKTLGEVVYREACQRVAYTSQLAEYTAHRREKVDATGVTYRPLCTDGAAPPAESPLVMYAVAAERQNIISAIDAAIPAPLVDDVDAALRAMMPAFEGPSVEAAVDELGHQLRRLSGDAQATAALARLGYRVGFFPSERAGGLLRSLLGTPGLHDALQAVLPVLVDSQPGAMDAPGAPSLSALVSALRFEMASIAAEKKPQAPDRTLHLFHRFLFTESQELATLPAGQAYYAIQRDHRGLPILLGAQFPSPYVDMDKDGYADSNSEGRLIDSKSKPIPFVTPFEVNAFYQKDLAEARDSQGRALVAATSQPLYNYINLDTTVLAALFREFPLLLSEKRDIPLRLVEGANFFLGPRKSQKKTTQESIEYFGFDETQSPLLDIIYGFTQLLTYSDQGSQTGVELNRLLRAFQLLINKHENSIARNLDAANKAFDEAKKSEYAEAILDDESTLYDDLAPIIVRMLRNPALIHDLSLALGDPATEDLGQIISLLATDSSQVFMNQDQLDTRGQPSDLSSVVGENGKRKVNPKLADSDFDKNPNNPSNNRSVLQRVLHIVHDANQSPFCNKDGAYINIKIVIDIKIAGPAKPCTLFQLDDLALYYLLSIASESVRVRDPYTNFINAITNPTLKTQAQALDALGLLDNLIGIPGFGKYPTPAMLARVLFQENSRRAEFFKTTLDFGACNPVRPGTLCSNQHLEWQKYYDGALFSLESIHPRDARGNLKHNVNFYTAFRPIVDAFAKHDECIQTDAIGSCVKWRNAGQILVDFLSVLHRHWPTAKSTFFNSPGYEPQQQFSGLSKYQALIAKLLASGDLWNSSRALAYTLANNVLDDGSSLPLSFVLARFVRFFFDPGAARMAGPLVFRDGQTQALRNDGKPTFSPTGDKVILDVLPKNVAGQVTPFDLLAAAYRNKQARAKQNEALAQRWQDAVGATADLYLTARTPGPGTYRLATPRLRVLADAGLSLLRDRVAAHGAARDVGVWVNAKLFPDVKGALTGPLGAAILSVLNELAQKPEAKAQLSRLLVSFLADPGPGSPDAARFSALLYTTADAVQLLADDQDLVPVLRPASGFLSDQVVGGFLGVLRRGLPVDSKRTFLTVAERLFVPERRGLTPAFLLSDAIGEINRYLAGDPVVLHQSFGPADYQMLLATAGQFMSDERRGLRRVLDIVNTRSGP